MNWLKHLFSRRRRFNDLSVSIQEHLEEKIDDLMEDGMSREEATRAARREFGHVTLIEERSREVWQWQWIENLLRDVRYALRGFRRNPLFSVTVIATLALGIGATTAIFSAVYSLLLRPLPYRDSYQLIYVSSVWSKYQSDTLISPDFVAAQNETKSFEQFAGYYIGN